MPLPLQDDAALILQGLAATPKGGAYTLPARPLFLPDGLTLGPDASGKRIVGPKGASLVLGQPVAGWRKAAAGDGLYSSLRANGCDANVLVADVADLAPLLKGKGEDGLILGDRPQSQTVFPLPTNGTRGDGWRDVTEATPLREGAQTLSYAPTDTPASWGRERLNAAIVEGFANEYRYARARIVSADAASVSIDAYQGRQTTGWTVGRNVRMRFRNVAEEIRLPGQYYLDLPDRKLYWYPPAGYDGSQPTYLSTDGGIAVRGADGVTLEGSGAALPIVGGLGTAVFLADTQGATLRRLDVVGGNGDGVVTEFPKGVGVENLPPCRNVVLDGCNVRECGGAGVYLLGGDRLRRVASGNVVQNCLVERIGRLVPDSQALTVLGMAPKVVDTAVRDVPQIGIAMNDPSGTPLGQRDGCNDALIDHCLVDGACKQVSDLGGIYHGRNWAALGNAIQNTTVRNVRAYVGQGEGQCCYGIYIDDGQAGTTVQDCTVTDVDAGVIVGGGWGVTLRRLRLDRWAKWSILMDARQAPGESQHALTEPDGRAYRTVTQWAGGRFAVPEPWKGIYPQLEAWVASAGSPTFGTPRFNTVEDVATGSKATPGLAVARTAQGYSVARDRAAFDLPGVTVTPSGVAAGAKWGAPAPPSSMRRP